MTRMELEAWDERGLDLERRANTPQMKEHLGGVEPEDRLVARHERILAYERAGRGRMFLITVASPPRVAGSVGYWQREWHGETVWEIGWQVLPEFQGLGLAATATTAALRRAAEQDGPRWVFAYPKATNGASNAVCRRVGFQLLGEDEFEYPPGTRIRCNVWRYDLRGADAPPPGPSGPLA
jgi:RimJ/RimL family protein N-acetyltransferase